MPFWIYYNGNNIQRTEGRNEPRDNLLLYRPQAGEAALAGGRGGSRCLKLKARLAGAVEAAYKKGMRHFLCGMARGADFYCCEAALALRERRPGVTVEAVIPCEEQAARWRERDRERWFSLVERCDNETMLQHHYDRGCMLRRNRYLVDHSAMLIAVYDGMLGGTMYTISYAMKRGLDVVTLDIP